MHIVIPSFRANPSCQATAEAVVRTEAFLYLTDWILTIFQVTEANKAAAHPGDLLRVASMPLAAVMAVSKAAMVDRRAVKVANSGRRFCHGPPLRLRPLLFINALHSNGVAIGNGGR